MEFQFQIFNRLGLGAISHRIVAATATITFLALLAIPVQPAAQEFLAVPKNQPRYRLIDLGTFGGPNSTDFASPIMNNNGAITGAADTADADPNAPNCYNYIDCFVTHTYIWRKGVLTDLGGLPGGFGSEGNWINDNNQGAGQSLNGLIDPLLGTPAGVAVFWKSNGQIVDLGTLGGNQSLAATINNRGQRVLSFHRDPSYGFTRHLPRRAKWRGISKQY